MKIEKRLRIKNDLGLHIRPAAAIAKLLAPFSSSVFFAYKKEKVNAKSVMSLLLLMAKKDAWITVTIEGDDAQDAFEVLKKAFETKFEDNL